jgi:hypothetical protein
VSRKRLPLVTAWFLGFTELAELLLVLHEEPRERQLDPQVHRKLLGGEQHRSCLLYLPDRDAHRLKRQRSCTLSGSGVQCYECDVALVFHARMDVSKELHHLASVLMIRSRASSWLLLTQRHAKHIAGLRECTSTSVGERRLQGSRIHQVLVAQLLQKVRAM